MKTKIAKILSMPAILLLLGYLISWLPSPMSKAEKPVPSVVINNYYNKEMKSVQYATRIDKPEDNIKAGSTK